MNGRGALPELETRQDPALLRCDWCVWRDRLQPWRTAEPPVRPGMAVRYRKAHELGVGWVANVIVCWHRRPGSKIRGLVWLRERGHTVTTFDEAGQSLLVDGDTVPWAYLERKGHR